METIKYFTLAAIREQNAEAFDASFKNALTQAVHDVGTDVAIKAFCSKDLKLTLLKVA